MHTILHMMVLIILEDTEGCTQYKTDLQHWPFIFKEILK